ncbi:MAG: prepilin-type N-terminal cleavage/methylation domain-containing protein [Planctomycetota bacterium]|jgi:type II secretory pathway pseudopilin PulG|nr:prepilin-type N-terminal cleavage/methylation domain-containing protein [Planctomycetota bacterium]
MTQRRAFTLIELTIALGLGLLVAYAAYAAFNTASQTIATVNRLALENRLMRAGYIAALEDADYWLHYDDPAQFSRVSGTMTNIDPNESPTELRLRDVSTLSVGKTTTRPRGRPFTAIADIPQASDPDVMSRADRASLIIPFMADSTYSAKSRTRLLWATGLKTADVGAYTGVVDPDPADDPTVVATDSFWFQIPDTLRAIDHFRTYVPEQPNLPGDLSMIALAHPEAPYSDKRYGRYGMIQNRWLRPNLGHGEDGRDIVQSSARYALDPADYPAANKPWPISWPIENVTDGTGHPDAINIYTGSFGVPSPGVLTLSRRAVRNRQLLDTMGNYGLLTYLPANDQIAWFGAEKDDRRLDERLAWDTTYQKNSWILRSLAGGSDIRHWEDATLTGRTSAFSSPTRASLFASFPLLADSPYTGGQVVGHLIDANFNGDNASGPNSSLSEDRWAQHLRSRWTGADVHPHTLAILLNRVVQVKPQLPYLPEEWPDLQLTTMRVATHGHFLANYRVRWIDSDTGEVAEISFNALGSTLRGARMQRHRDGGWARFYSFASPSNDPTLDHVP